jgi:DNA-binding NarL/FixJ family response regulator
MPPTNSMISTHLLKPVLQKGIKIMQMYADGYDTDQIAQMIGLSRRTVELYAAQTMEAFEAKNRGHLIAKLFREGYLK